LNKPGLNRIAALILAAGMSSGAVADLEDISNFRSYSESFASSGQPSKRELGSVRDAGFERVIYLAFTTSGTAIDDEDEIVKELGMDYVHIPVDWENPTSSDFYAFAGVMQSGPSQKTLLHCQVNFRASVFSFLYRVIHEGVGVADAKEDLNSVWQPNETWVRLIFEVLEENSISPECEVCDWTAGKH
jgi:protein tyrosine phosphatase (PTP) superfamily phosphohydrolase (DUF442 family)